ncbi:MAG: hypothetical protein P1U34_01445 [Coxiellaceae bacterium]|nr:hypothetical protein [Coxiellaceae bacterium]
MAKKKQPTLNAAPKPTPKKAKKLDKDQHEVQRQKVKVLDAKQEQQLRSDPNKQAGTSLDLARKARLAATNPAVANQLQRTLQRQPGKINLLPQATRQMISGPSQGNLTISESLRKGRPLTPQQSEVMNEQGGVGSQSTNAATPATSPEPAPEAPKKDDEEPKIGSDERNNDLASSKAGTNSPAADTTPNPVATIPTPKE